MATTRCGHLERVDGAGGEPPPDEGAALHEVAAGVWAWVQPDGSWWLNNAGVVAGDDGTAVVVDTCATAERTRRFLDAADSATGGAAVTLAVNTHQHGDHTYGNCLLPSSTTIVGHAAMREGLLADVVIDGCPPFWEPVPDWGGVTKRVPTVAMADALTVFAGHRRVELRHPGHAAHTPGDVVAWVPDERVLFAGDLLFAGLTPLVFMGSVDGARRALDWLAAFGADHVVPGHGPVLHGAPAVDAVLAEHDRYYALVAELARTGRAQGQTPLAAARAADLGTFARWADAERIVLNLHRAYADADAADMDASRAFVDAVAYNGGPLRTHVCGVTGTA